jgi:hypothetical protein
MIFFMTSCTDWSFLQIEFFWLVLLADEFLVHGVDVEGMRVGIIEDLVQAEPCDPNPEPQTLTLSPKP